MKYLILFLAFSCCEVFAFGRSIPVQTTKVYVIHTEKRVFVRKPMRRYLRHKRIIKKEVIKKRTTHPQPRPQPRQHK